MRQISTTLAPETQSASGHRVADKGAQPTESRIHESNAQNLAGQAHAFLPLKTAQSVGPQKADHTNAALRKKRLDEDGVLVEEGRSQVMIDMADVDAMADTLPAQHAQLYAQASTDSEVATDAGAVSNSAGSITTATTSSPALGSVGLLGLGGFTFVGLAAAGLSGSKSTPTPTADSTAPKLDLSMAGTPQQGVTVVFTFSFNEDVTGFTSSSIKLSGGTPGNFVAVDARTYTLEVTVGSSGQPLIVSVAPGAAKDLAGNAYAEGLVFETTSIAPPVEPPSPLEPPAPAPDTTAPKFTLGTAASVAFAENATGNVHTASATDNVAVMAYAFAGGKDDDKFNLDTASGAITFKTPPDFEAPSSAAGTNNYTVRVKATDAAGNSMVQEITVNVTNVDDVSPTVPDTSDTTAPTFKSINPSVSVPENTSTTVHTAVATDNVGVTAYAFAGGADDGKFNLDTANGALTFKLAPDFEVPGSAAGSNAYTVKLKAIDAAGNSTVQTVTLNVTDVAEVLQGQLIDSPVAGVEVWANGAKIGTTDAGGYFNYTQGQTVSFKIGNLTLAEGVQVPGDQKVYIHDIVGVDRSASVTSDPRMVILAQLLQTLDVNNDPNDGISVDATRLLDALQPTTILQTTNVADLLDQGVVLVTPGQAIEHVNENAPFLKSKDNTPPTATISISDQELTDGETAIVQVQFSEPVKFTSNGNLFTGGSLNSMMIVENGTLSEFKPFDVLSDRGRTFTAVFTPKENFYDETSVIKINSAYATKTQYVDLAGNLGGGASSGNFSVKTNSAWDQIRPIFDNSNVELDVVENTKTGTVVYTAKAIDNVGVTNYTLSGTDAAQFRIDSKTGQVTMVATPDYESQSSYSIVVDAKDARNNEASQAVTINILDANETEPVNVVRGTYLFTDVAAHDTLNASNTYKLDHLVKTFDDINIAPVRYGFDIDGPWGFDPSMYANVQASIQDLRVGLPIEIKASLGQIDLTYGSNAVYEVRHENGKTFIQSLAENQQPNVTLNCEGPDFSFKCSTELSANVSAKRNVSMTLLHLAS